MPMYYSAGALLFFILALFTSIGLTLFVTQAIALSDIAKERGEEKHWLAWIPMGNIILLMMLIEKTDKPLVKNKMVIYFGLLVVLSIFTLPIFTVLNVPLLNNPLMPMLIPAFWTLIVFRVLAADYTNHSIIHMFIGLITMGFSVPFQLYSFRNRMLENTQNNKRRKTN